MHNNRTFKSVCAMAVSALLVMQNLSPAVSVLADEIKAYDETNGTTIEFVTEPSVVATESDEVVIVPTDETNEAVDENVESVPADDAEPSEVSEDVGANPPIEQTDVTEPAETEAPAELIVFDHYYTEIDESVVNTSDLFVQTSDASVFTLSTNVVSNYDDVYIIACDSVEEARYAYSYYVGKVDNITDLASVISIASEDNEDNVADLSNINNGEDAISNLNEIDVNDYSEYIALIDTGADADVNFSVVGDNTADSNGHGTAMLGYIREENPDARVMSIKVFDDSNTTNAANVYAGIKLAIESNVSVINLSLVGADIEQNAIVKEVIQEAIDNDIVVIGAAGNYNLNAANYIPGCIDGVITVGAVNEDGTKYATSNYNADLYVIATSTSEAAARYSGIYTSGNSSDKVYGEYIIPAPAVTPTAAVTPVPTSVEDDFVDDRDFDTYAADMAELGISVTIDENGNYVYNILEDNFGIADITYTNSITNLDTNHSVDLGSYYSAGVGAGNDNGTCSFTGNGNGEGIARGFISDPYRSTPGGLTIDAFGRDLTSVCARHWGEDESRGARSISGTNVQCWYESSYAITYDSSTSVYRVEFVIRLSQRPNMTPPQWSLINTSIGYNISSESNGSGLVRYTVEFEDGTKKTTGWVEATSPNAKNYIADKITEYITSYIIDASAYSGNRDVSINNNTIYTSTGDHTAFYSYKTSSDTQVFRAQLVAQQVATAPDLPLDLTKVNSASAYNIMTQGNSCYNFAGTQYTLYADPACTQALFTYTFGSDGHTTGGIFSLPGNEIANEPTYFLRETAAGPGYFLDTTVYSVSFHADRTVTVSGGSNATVTISQSADADHPAEITLADVPMTDPFSITVIKDNTVNTTTTFRMDAVTFHIQYYAGDYDVATSLAGVNPTDDFYVTVTNTSTNDYISIMLRLQHFAGQDPSVTVTGDNDYLAGVYNASALVGKEPLGTYIIQESTAPTGYDLNPTVYRARLYDGGNAPFVQIVNTTTNTDVTGLITVANGVSDFAWEMAESYTIGYYSLTKTITDTREQNNLAGFEFSMYWVNNGTYELFATGTSQSDGRVYWTYQLANYGHLEDDGETVTPLTGTRTYNLEILTGETYQVRETAVYYPYGNQNSGLQYIPYTPQGWTSHTDNGTIDYFYKTVTATANQSISDTEVNDWEESAGFSVYKTKPTGDLFDLSMVTFTAYTYVNGIRYDIATGTVDTNGNVIWTRTDTSGYGIYQSGNYDNRTSVNSLVSLPCGTYYVEEAWDKMYVDTLDAATQDAVEVFATNNTSDWATNDAGTEYISTITVDCTTPNTTTTVALNNPQNDWHYQWFSANKIVTVAGDASTIDFELYYNNGTDLVLFATGYAETTGVGTFSIIWDGYQGPAEFIQNNGQMIVLPEGDYEIREIVPGTYYQNGADNVPYTYMVPTGWQDHLGANGHSDYFYTTFSAANNAETTINSINPTNTRIEAELTIRKVEQSNSPSQTFTFAIYYRGNEDQAQNLGDFSDQYLLDTVTVTTTNGSGLTTLTKIPEGWYEIVEINANGWECVWMNTSTNTANGKLVHASSENKTVSQIVISDDIEMSGTVLAGVWATNVIRPELHTSATTAIGNVVEYSDEATITDRVFFSHLVVGLEYTVTGNLAVKKDYAEGEEVEYVRDANGNIVTASKTFTAEATEGYVDVVFTFDATLYLGETLVAFETLTYNGIEYATHADIDDEEQTVYVPAIGTTATDANGNKTFHVTDQATVIDEIAFENLEVGRTYLAEGILMDKTTGEPLLVNGEQVTASATFVPETANGKVTVTFTFNASALAGKSVVVFEKVYDISGTTTIDQDTGLIVTDETAKILIATHEDVNDENQTVNIIETKTNIIETKTGDNSGFGTFATCAAIAAGVAGIAGLAYAALGRKKKNQQGEA